MMTMTKMKKVNVPFTVIKEEVECPQLDIFITDEEKTKYERLLNVKVSTYKYFNMVKNHCMNNDCVAQAAFDFIFPRMKKYDGNAWWDQLLSKKDKKFILDNKDNEDVLEKFYIAHEDDFIDVYATLKAHLKILDIAGCEKLQGAVYRFEDYSKYALTSKRENVWDKLKEKYSGCLYSIEGALRDILMID